MLRTFLLIFPLLWSVTTWASAADYVVSLSPDLRTLAVTACFDDTPSTLRAGDAAASRYLRALAWQHDAPKPVRRGQRLILQPQARPACLNYDVDVGTAADDRALRRSGWVGDDLVVSPELWLWRPDQSFTLRFSLPDDIVASVPWPPVARRDGRIQYRAGTTPAQWAGQAAFGRLAMHTISLPGGHLRVALANPDAFTHRDDVLHWLRATASAMTTIYGRAARDSVQVLVLPGDHDSPVPWGQVLRGGAPAVNFYVDQGAQRAALMQDWTAFHEFSHLFLPFIQRRDSYLSEGFASYFQNVTRARSGNLDETQAWTNLVDGFQRGREATRGQTLRDATREMGRQRNFMRVYWSGAAIALLGDVQLRTRDDDAPGLDQVLASLQDCCMQGDRAWSARALASQLDQNSKSDIFAPLIQELAPSRRFPPIAPVLQALGVERDGTTVTLDDDAPLAHVRRAIMRSALTP